MSLLVCVDAVLEKVEFDLLTPSPGSGEVEEGVGEGKVNIFFRHVRASHTLLAKLSGNALFPHRPQIPRIIKNRKMLGFVQNCI